MAKSSNAARHRTCVGREGRNRRRVRANVSRTSRNTSREYANLGAEWRNHALERCNTRKVMIVRRKMTSVSAPRMSIPRLGKEQRGSETDEPHLVMDQARSGSSEPHPGKRECRSKMEEAGRGKRELSARSDERESGKSEQVRRTGRDPPGTSEPDAGTDEGDLEMHLSALASKQSQHKQLPRRATLVSSGDSNQVASEASTHSSESARSFNVTRT